MWIKYAVSFRSGLLGLLLHLVLNLGATLPGFAAAPRSVGLGIIIGSPTGLSGKYNLSNYNAVDAALAWHFRSGVQIHADYLWIEPDFIKTSAHPIAAYVGVGARVRTWSGNGCGKYRSYRNSCDYDSGASLGLRVPLGFNYVFTPDKYA